ncbi:MAG: multidrug resistance protein [Planctomycetota bacterium]|nr:MAG: multidrug resistance protein [Planctomycetota bacterium]
MNAEQPEPSGGMSGLVSWMARNHVAANLLMWGLLLGGGFVALSIKQEVFPSFQLDIVEVSAPYPGASPEEIEEGLLLPIEEAIRGLEVAERVVAEAQEGSGTLSVELVSGADANRALQDVKTAIDRISFFPDDAERPTVELAQELENVLWMVVHGPLDERQIFALAEQVRRELLELPELSQVELRLGRTPEIAIEIPQARLRSLGLTPGDVADTVRASARDLPGGGVRTPGGEYLLRTKERRDLASAYADIVLVSTADGTKVRLGDVAQLVDGFEDKPTENWFNGGRGIFITVYQIGDEKPLEISGAVNEYLEGLRAALPPGCDVTILRDRGEQYRDRLMLLLKNGSFGLLLVILVLGLFIQPRLAFWVAAGIPTTLIGALLLLPLFGASVNMISLFAFIITLGMVVDDAVIVGENVFHAIEQGTPRLRAAIDATRAMIVPVLYAVATNIIAFLPLLFVPGEIGRFFAPLPAVVIAVFLVSLVEALFVLPAHLAHAKRMERAAPGDAPAHGLWAALGRVQRRCAAGVDSVVERGFLPMLRVVLTRRWAFAACLAALSVVSWAYFASGRVKYTFNPVIVGTRVDCEIQTPPGAPFAETARIARHVEAAGLRAAARLHEGGADAVLQGRMNIVGRRGENWADVNLILVEADDRDFDQGTFASVWREEIGSVAGLESIYFEWEEGPGSGAGLTVEVSHPDRQVLESAATALAGALAEYRGVTDIKDGFASGKPQVDVSLTGEGLSLGLTPQGVGRQVRQAFFGAEALRLQRGRHEVRVMVRLPPEERRSLAAVEDLIIRTPDGGETPLAQVAQLHIGRAFTQIDRVDGRRVLNVTANTVPEIVNINDVRAALEADVLPQLLRDHPGTSFEFGGRQRDERRAINELSLGLALALAAIFALLAGLFRSYAQALLVMLSIPVALAAAMWAHVLLRHDLSVVSLFGMMALCGLVVNAGLVLNDEVNNRLASGLSLPEAVLAAARRRFRPVVLTSLTTFAGLTPMIAETAPQALFLVPMAIALGFGVLVSGLILLVWIPAARLLLADLGGNEADESHSATPLVHTAGAAD